MAIVHPDVGQSGSIGVVLNRHAVAELMLDAPEGPFLSEAVGPGFPARRADKVVYVLNDAPRLVVRLLDEKAVVLDLCGTG